MYVYSPYALSTHGGAAEKGLFEQLFPPRSGTSAPKSDVDGTAPRNAVAAVQGVELARPVDAPSPSPSDRIRAWEAALAKAGEHSRSTVLESSDLVEFQDLVDSRQSHDASYAQHDGTDGGAANAVPFALRSREVERRFREQMEVHRELTAASRRIDVVSSSVHAFRAERRTRALLQAITARQEAVWASVWPEGAPEITEGGVTAAYPFMPGPMPHPQTPATKVPPAPAEGAGSPATGSPPPPASPSGSLLKEILSTFSKPRELRRAASSAAPHGSGASAAAPTSEAVVPAPRRTVSGVEIVRPEPAPLPYPVVRYVEATVRSSRSPPAVAPTPLGGDGTDHARRRATWSLSSAEALRGRSSEIEEEGEAGYSQHFSDVADDAASGSSVKTVTDHSSDGVHTERSYSQEAYTSDAFDSDIPSERVSSDRSVEGTSASARTDSISTASGVHSSASARSSSRTASVASESSASANASRTPTRRRHHRRNHGRHGNSDVSAVLGDTDAMQPLADVLHAFYEACRSVTAASSRLLKDSRMRAARAHDADGAKEPSASSEATRNVAGSVRSGEPPALTSTSSPSVASSASSPSAAAAPLSADASRPTPNTAVEEWGAALQRQLRRVRRLQRFRDHLLRHLERLDAQRQAQRKATQLLQQTKALAHVRDEMRSGAATRKGASLADLLKGVKGIAAVATRAAPPRQGAPRTSRASRFEATSEVSEEDDDVPSEALSSMSSIRSEVGSEVDSENSAITEDIAGFGTGTVSAVSDSVITEDPQGWDSGTAPVSEVASASTAMLDTTEDNSYAEDSFEVPSEEMRSSVVVTANGLDEIEEELADRLAELSSGALSVNTSIPSDVVELVDLLPSSFIPSEVEESGVATEVATMSSAAASEGSSAAELRSRQRRLYVGAKAAAVQGGVRDGAGYLRDSPASSVYSVPEDADVDASARPSSVDAETDTSAHPAAASPARADADTADGAAETLPTTADVTAAPQRGGVRDSEASSYARSSSDDALTALEADMALTKRRRQHALRSATAVPTFAQLYDPAARPTGDASRSDSADAASDSGDSESGASGGSGSEPSEGSSASTGRQDPAAAPGTPPSGARQSDVARGVAVAPAPTPIALSRVQAGAQADPPAAASADGLTRSKGRVYPVEDYVAQQAWKARQLHLLRQLRSAVVEGPDGLSAPRVRDGGGDTSEAVTQPATRSSVDVALDAAEAAAREEWTRHWGVVESLLHTRFTSAASKPPSRVPPPSQVPRALHRRDAYASLSSTSSTPRSRDASQSAAATTSSFTSAGSTQ